jgi:hypothetical protein
MRLVFLSPFIAAASGGLTHEGGADHAAMTGDEETFHGVNAEKLKAERTVVSLF